MVGYPAPCGEKIFLRSPSPKTAKFEVKIRRKSVKEPKEEHLLFVTSLIIKSNKIRFSDRNELNKVVILDGSNNAGESGGGAHLRRF